MKRGGPIRRRTPMRRTAPMPRQRPSAPRSRAKRMRRAPMPADVRAGVYERAGGMCDWCGNPLNAEAWDAHHRQLRSRGGKDTPENLVALHPRCHHDSIHAHPATATRTGFMVPSWADPADVPILRHGRTWLHPTAGGWTPGRPIEGANDDQ